MVGIAAITRGPRWRPTKTVYVPFKRGMKYSRLSCNTPVATNALVKWKYSVVVTPNLVNAVVAYLNFGLGGAGFTWTTTLADLNFVNGPLRNTGAQTYTLLTRQLINYLRVIQYGIKVRIKWTWLSNIAIGNANIFMGPVNDTSTVDTTAPRFSIKEIPEMRVWDPWRQFSADSAATTAVTVRTFTTERYFDLKTAFPNWRMDRMPLSSAIDVNGVPGDPAVATNRGPVLFMGIYTQDNNVLGVTAAIRMEIDVTNYYEAFERRQVVFN